MNTMNYDYCTAKDAHRKAVLANVNYFQDIFDEICTAAENGFYNIRIKDSRISDPKEREKLLVTLEEFNYNVTEMYEEEMYISW